MKETFGEYIRSLRNKNDLTLTQLAAKLDMDSANLSKVENGKREFDIKRLRKLADAFDVDLDQLTEEYLSDRFAKTIYETRSNPRILQMAEKKIEYLTLKNAKQGKLRL